SPTNIGSKNDTVLSCRRLISRVKSHDGYLDKSSTQTVYPDWSTRLPAGWCSAYAHCHRYRRAGCAIRLYTDLHKSALSPYGILPGYSGGYPYTARCSVYHRVPSWSRELRQYHSRNNPPPWSSPCRSCSRHSCVR